MLTLYNVSKTFKKSKKAVLNNVSFSIKEGQIVALVGKNGAGKSTLIRIISGLLLPDSGRIITNTGDSIGVIMGGDVQLYKHLTGYEITLFLGALRGLNKIDISKKIDELDCVLHFSGFIHEKTYMYSRGMRQKIAMLLSIVHDPSILLMDEPSTGLDLESSNDVIEFIKYLSSEGKAILIATHNIFEISDLSNVIAPLKNGTINHTFSTKEFFSGSNTEEKVRRITTII